MCFGSTELRSYVGLLNFFFLLGGGENSSENLCQFNHLDGTFLCI